MRESKYYELTKDGFMFLVMGFTGKKAAEIKVAFINAFNEMDAQLRKNPRTCITPEQKTLPLNAPFKLDFPDTTEKRLLNYYDMMDCGWKIRLSEALYKLSEMKGQTVDVVDISGLRKELFSLMHLVEIQHSRLERVSQALGAW